MWNFYLKECCQLTFFTLLSLFLLTLVGNLKFYFQKLHMDYSWVIINN